MVKALQVTISGSYRTATKEVVDFDDLTGIVPYVDEDVAIMHVRRRYAIMWITGLKDEAGDKVYPKRVDSMRQVFIDDIKEVDVEQFSYVGKDIKELSFPELQDLATAKDLRLIPLPKETSGISLREMRVRAYADYSEKVKGAPIDYKSNEFNYAKLPSMIVDGDVRVDMSEKISNEEIISSEQKSPSTDDPRSRFTLDELKQLAQQKGIRGYQNMKFETLYKKLYT